jgi:hypothetical protein
MKGGTSRPTTYRWVQASIENGETPGAVGGEVARFTATQQMKVGDVVFLKNVVNQVDKSVTVANYAAACGVVVGGYQTGMNVVDDPTVVGTMIAANANEDVLVCYSGIAYVVADAALATIGTKLSGAATTAGRVGSVGAAAGNYVGLQLDVAAAAGNVIRLAVNLA